MSATDELRLLLNARGIVWRDNNGDTEFCGADGRMLVAWDAGEDREHMLTLTRLTSYQAVEIALGGGKCKIVRGVCSGCGALIHESANMYWQYFDGGFRTVMHKPVNYCPNCGREVEK